VKGTGMAINKNWHMKNKMPKNPTPEQRINWHIRHSKNCNCRPIPEKLLKEIGSRGKNLKRKET
jgi:hypothetical protein